MQGRCRMGRWGWRGQSHPPPPRPSCITHTQTPRSPAHERPQCLRPRPRTLGQLGERRLEQQRKGRGVCLALVVGNEDHIVACSGRGGGTGGRQGEGRVGHGARGSGRQVCRAGQRARAQHSRTRPAPPAAPPAAPARCIRPPTCLQLALDLCKALGPAQHRPLEVDEPPAVRQYGGTTAVGVVVHRSDVALCTVRFDAALSPHFARCPPSPSPPTPPRPTPRTHRM